MDSERTVSSRVEKRQKIKDDIHKLSSDDLVYFPAKKKDAGVTEITKKRTAAYCRVSTDDPAQTTSYELQKEHYEEEINKNPDWIFAGIYADEGISATSMKHRDNFNRLIKDCEMGKIDMIVTKSVSRFARNVVDCLSVVRYLSSLNPPVGVKFETEGISTLDSTSELILTVMAASAEEESKNKRNSMIWSLEKRFEKGRFLTPVLLGYDHDEDGNLIINKDEAQTVKLMYYMFLAGFPISEIADVLTQLKRKTKLGNIKWSPNTVRAVMQNERHCGNVLSWKTFTYDFWEHKKRKNHEDMPQVLKIDHHEAIVSHEIFDATQHKLAAERCMKHSIPMPKLEVVTDGLLQGFVPVNLLWSGFSGEDYEKASESVYDESTAQNTSDTARDSAEEDSFSLDGYKVVKSYFFSTASKPTMSIAKGQVRFNTVCLKKFEDVEYVELLFNSVEKYLAVRPCSKENPNAIGWGKLKNSRWIVRAKSCSGFAGPLYNLMSWDADCGYKLCGQYLSQGDDKLLVFDLSDPLITMFEKHFVDEDGEEVDPEDVVRNRNAASGRNAFGNRNEVPKEKKIHIMYKSFGMEPDFWKETSSGGRFNIIVFDIEKYADNWEIMRPANVFMMSGNLSEETMQHVMQGAISLKEELMLKSVAGL